MLIFTFWESCNKLNKVQTGKQPAKSQVSVISVFANMPLCHASCHRSLGSGSAFAIEQRKSHSCEAQAPGEMLRTVLGQSDGDRVPRLYGTCLVPSTWCAFPQQGGWNGNFHGLSLLSPSSSSAPLVLPELTTKSFLVEFCISCSSSAITYGHLPQSCQ